MSLRGGGTAGGGRSNKNTPQFIRRVPKFLQKYEHLMGRGSNDPDDEGPQVCSAQGEAMPAGPAGRAGSPDSSDFAEELEGATVVEDGSGAFLDETRAAAGAVAAKEKGNAAYSEGRHEDAIRHFTEAMELSPRDPVLYSNRSAAHASKRDYAAAESDARKAVELRPRWAKAHSRLGAALVGLQKLEEAEAAYQRGLKEEAGNPTLQQGLQQVQEKLRRQETEAARDGRHVFKKRKPTNSLQPPSSKSSTGVKKGAAGGKSGRLLSFAEDAEEEHG